MALGLAVEGRLVLRNVHFPVHAEALAGHGGRAVPALWDGAVLHEGLAATLSALEAAAFNV